MAVRYNPSTNEPYLQFPAPHAHLRLTPMRFSDGPATIAAMNDPRVYMNILSPPFPYLPHHWDQQFAAIDAATRRAREELDAVEAWRKDGMQVGSPKRWVGSGLPFTAIREVVVVSDDGREEERFLGRVNVRRKDYRTVADEGERAALKAANDAKIAGDPEIEWEMGCKSSFSLFPHFWCFGKKFFFFNADIMLIRTCSLALPFSSRTRRHDHSSAHADGDILRWLHECASAERLSSRPQ